MPDLFSWRARALPSFAVLCLILAAPVALALSGSRAPSENFDLRRWKLTLPSAEDIDPYQLNSGYSYYGVFFTDPRTGGMVFRCPNRAGTTANSSYSRTELRGMLDPYNSNAKAASNNWTPEQGGWLKADLRVDRVSTTGYSDKVGRVVLGQIHGPYTEPLRLHYTKKPGERTGRIYAATETVGGTGRHSPDIVSNANGGGIALGERFRYSIKLVNTRLDVLIYRADGRIHRWSTYIDSRYRGLPQYFKAGVYNQNNTGDGSDYAQATFFALQQVSPYRP
ncbi:MAG: Extracellular alginate lyase [Panacagrimonas sp.]|jgi:poly(beta-D-mannuronate) lyase|nr:polysaccharide lyase family 7 protein [Panacagrimonas sp.]MCC2655486.1 Extracellular alginate lyase [Panacagrimonas sp.]